MRFRKRPVEIEAMQWDGTAQGATEIINWALGFGGTIRYHEERVFGDLISPAHLSIDTPEGTMNASPLDWIIRGVADEVRSCKPDIFNKTYEPLDG